ncbi:RNA polymerase II-associated protein 3 isoform X1 [Temnothorax curvispinosus]|uniref:RNA polymerase II-associated protein 3 n=1 Tax=Temnothorax curvispinosus TaxID=300111 RepID=A0A6J1R7H6_9HYME|nr:RNA polymerase II-associated protein 3 isoform X1 [Temnothorax curvispinosus]XP_024890608.1 RNA polymerase II-associated protein 3 isoform X1 [Temnothorax curvispinosus]
MALDNSILMQKQVRDNSEDLQSELLDLKNWEEQMKRKEQKILNERIGQQIIPPVRSKNKKKCEIKEMKTSTNSKRIKSYDYTSWDKFDINKACKEVDNAEQSDESFEEILSKEELENNHIKAIEYKQQGNDFVKQKKWDKAIASYSEAIKIFPYDAIFYANRALCYLKQENLYSAEADCSSAIQLDKTYVKAYHRRVTARLGLKQYKEAMDDIQKIAELEPCSKETEILLSQLEKFGSGKSFMSVKDVRTADVSDHEKKDDKVIDTKKDTNKKSSANVDNTVKPTTGSATSVTESKKDRRIPDWLPEKDNVEIVEPIDKPPHLRSKEPLKRIPVQVADLTKPFKSFEEEIKATCSKNQHVELSYVHPGNITKQKENVATCKPKENFIESFKEMPPIPKNAVQFLLNWRKYTSFDFRYRYLKQIPLGSLPKIFRDSMESDIFSDILMTLKTEFMKRNEPIFSYLKDLSNVKRFRAFIMFITNSEKQDLKLMFSYCNTSEKIPEKEVTDLQNKYEI